MSAKVERTCACCGKKFLARVADVARGWARFCSKRCKAINQESGRMFMYAMPGDISDIHDLDEPR